MLQLNPQEYFAITRQLNDPADTSTYYLRAYVRNARTDELLDTVDLVDKGDQRFRKEWQVPADVSGEGTYITILVKVFTDSGYTTESMLYGRVEESYLIQQRLSIALAGGRGPDVSYKKIREIINEELKKLPQYIKPKDINWEPILNALRENYEKIDSIKFPPQKEVDLGPIARIIERSNMDVARAIKGINIPSLDLSPVIEKLSKIKTTNEISDENVKEYIEKLKDAFSEALNQINESIGKVDKKFLKPMKIQIAPTVGIASQEEEKPKRRKFI